MAERVRTLPILLLLAAALPSQDRTEVHRSFRAESFDVCAGLPAACFDREQRAWTLLREHTEQGDELVLRGARREHVRIPTDRGALLTADGDTLTVVWQQRDGDRTRLLTRAFATDDRQWLGEAQQVAEAPWLFLHAALQVRGDRCAVVYGVAADADGARQQTVLLRTGDPRQPWRAPILVTADTELRQVALAGDAQHLAIGRVDAAGHLFVDMMPVDADSLRSNVGAAVGDERPFALRDDHRFAMTVSDGWVQIALFEQDADHEVTLVRSLATAGTFGTRRYDCIATGPPMMLPQPGGAAVVLLPATDSIDFVVDGNGRAPQIGTMAQHDARIEATSAGNQIAGVGALLTITSQHGETPWRALVEPFAADTLTHQFEPVFSLRTDDGRRNAIKSRYQTAAIGMALQWLHRHQDDDGRWDCDGFDKHDADGSTRCDGPGNPVHDIGVTGLATLALLAQGRGERHDAVVHRALQWLMSQRDPSGRFGPGNTEKFIYDHAIATTAIAEASAVYLIADYRRSAQAAIDYLERHRNPYAVWRYQVRDSDNDLSVTTWCVQAYHAAGLAGLTVKPTSMMLAATFLDQVSDPTGRHGYTKPGEPSWRMPGDHAVRFPRELGAATVAMGLYARLLLGQDPKQRVVMLRAADLISSKPPVWDEKRGSIDHYYWYYACQAMQHMGRPYDRRWYRVLDEHVIKQQHRDPKEANLLGSWDPIGAWGEIGGRVYATAILCLTLQAPYRLKLSAR